MNESNRQLAMARLSRALSVTNEALDFAYRVGLRAEIVSDDGDEPRVQIKLMRPVDLSLSGQGGDDAG